MGACEKHWPVTKCLPALALVLAITTSRSAMCEKKTPEYLVRIAHETPNETACVLLASTGEFHYEAGDENVKVFEGKLATDRLESVRRDLLAFANTAQADIEEPLIHGPRDLLDIHFFQLRGAKELLFRSSESQQPYRASLKPLLQWMYSLPRLADRELTEDAGKQNCLPRSKIRLKTRNEVVPEPPLTRTPIAGRRITVPPVGVAPASVQPLVRFELLQKSSSVAQQRCALIADDGRYRFEYRSQKVGSKKVENRLALGRLAQQQLKRLRDLLDSPALVRIRHRDPPGGMPLNIMGAVLDLSIKRGSSFQDVTLTDNTHRNTFFYSGDGDIGAAKPLMDLIRGEIETMAHVADSEALNGCDQLP